MIDWLFRFHQSLSNINLTKFRELIDDFFILLPFINKKTATILLGFLLNYAALGTKRNLPTYQLISFELYQKGLESELLIENNLIDLTIFNNIVSLARFFGKIDDAKAFILRYGRYLPKNIQEPAINLAKAEILFSEQQYVEALKLLKPLQRKHISLKLRQYPLKLICYYEIEKRGNSIVKEITPIQSFRMFLRTKEVSKSNAIAGKNFIKIYTKLDKQENPDISNQDLKEQLKNMGSIFYKSWLQKAIEQR